jgi:hypothetical protein
MSVILTSQFNRSQTITTANALGILRGKAGQHGTPIHSSAPAPHALPPDFSIRLMHDLTHAYTLVLVVSIVVVALTLVPVAFLPNKPPPAGKRPPPVPAY